MIARVLSKARFWSGADSLVNAPSWFIDLVVWMLGVVSAAPRGSAVGRTLGGSVRVRRTEAQWCDLRNALFVSVLTATVDTVQEPSVRIAYTCVLEQLRRGEALMTPATQNEPPFCVSYAVDTVALAALGAAATGSVVGTVKHAAKAAGLHAFLLFCRDEPFESLSRAREVYETHERCAEVRFTDQLLRVLEV